MRVISVSRVICPIIAYSLNKNFREGSNRLMSSSNKNRGKNQNSFKEVLESLQRSKSLS